MPSDHDVSNLPEEYELILPAQFELVDQQFGVVIGAFDTEEEAWDYCLRNRLCNRCREDVTQGGEDIPNVGFYPVTHISETTCGTHYRVRPRGEE